MRFLLSTYGQFVVESLVSRQIRDWGKVVKLKPFNQKFIAAAAFAAAQWQPAHAQVILGSIPDISGRLVLAGERQRRGDLQIRFVQAQGRFLEHRSHDSRHEPLILCFRQCDGERQHPQHEAALFRSGRAATVDVWRPAQATARQEDRTHHRADGSKVIDARRAALKNALLRQCPSAAQCGER